MASTHWSVLRPIMLAQLLSSKASVQCLYHPQGWALAFSLLPGATSSPALHQKLQGNVRMHSKQCILPSPVNSDETSLCPASQVFENSFGVSPLLLSLPWWFFRSGHLTFTLHWRSLDLLVLMFPVLVVFLLVALWF